MGNLDHDLDRLLGEAAPLVSARHPEVVRATHEVARMAEAEARRPSRRRASRGARIALGVAALAVGGTGVAAAAPHMSDWFNGKAADRVIHDRTTRGADCLQAFRIQPKGTSDDDPAVVVARQTLATLDPATLDLDAAREQLGLDEAGAAEVGDSGLIHMAVFQALLDEVDRRGLDKGTFSLEGATNCTADDL